MGQSRYLRPCAGCRAAAVVVGAAALLGAGVAGVAIFIAHRRIRSASAPRSRPWCHCGSASMDVVLRLSLGRSDRPTLALRHRLPWLASSKSKAFQHGVDWPSTLEHVTVSGAGVFASTMGALGCRSRSQEPFVEGDLVQVHVRALGWPKDASWSVPPPKYGIK